VKDLVSSFGVAIAFLLPGFVGLWGASRFLQPLGKWFEQAAQADSGTGVVLFIIIAALAMGVVISAARIVTVELVFRGIGKLVAKTGLHGKGMDFKRLATNDAALKALDFLNEGLYRFYLFYANMAVAVALAYVALVLKGSMHLAKTNLTIFSVIEAVLLIGGADAFARYWKHANEVLSGEGGSR
jgi:hypothetical protein